VEQARDLSAPQGRGDDPGLLVCLVEEGVMGFELLALAIVLYIVDHV
jgi:hypothetical protein